MHPVTARELTCRHCTIINDLHGPNHGTGSGREETKKHEAKFSKNGHGTCGGIVVHLGALIVLPVLNSALGVRALVRPSVVCGVDVVLRARHSVSVLHFQKCIHTAHDKQNIPDSPAVQQWQQGHHNRKMYRASQIRMCPV